MNRDLGAVTVTALAAGFALGNVSGSDAGPLAWVVTVVIVALFLFVFLRATR